MAKKRQMAQELQQAQPKVHRQERMGQERRQCEAVISEFTGTDTEATLHAMAAEILEYRRAFLMLECAVAYAHSSAPFAVMGPGPLWKPKPGRELPEWLTRWREWRVSKTGTPASLDRAEPSQ